MLERVTEGEKERKTTISKGGRERDRASGRDRESERAREVNWTKVTLGRIWLRRRR